MDWIFVVLGAVIAVTGGWIQLHPERMIPGQPGSHQSGPGQFADWQIDPAARVKIRVLGAFFLFMGVFFAIQMTIDLMGRPWWTGTLSGLVTAITAVTLVYARVRRQQRRRRHFIQQLPLAGKALELR